MPPFFDERGDPALSPFTVLNLPTTASEPEIKKAYRTAMLQLHPDKLSPSLSEAEIAQVTEKFHNVKDAYEFLTSPQYLTARRLYQAKLASQRAEYERREAFLRRAGMDRTGHSSDQTARTRMNHAPDPVAQRRRQGSHAIDPSKSRHRARAAKGYTSDQGVNFRARASGDKRNKPRVPRSDQPRSSSRGGGKAVRTRAESEPRTSRQKYHDCESDVDDRVRFKDGSAAKRRPKNGKTSTGSDTHGGRRRPTERAGRHQQHQQQRGRAKSAPARCRAPEKRNHGSSNNNNKQQLPREFYCPLSKRVMRDPVVDPEGNAYEREAIERWLRVQNSSPITNGYLSVDMLRPSKELKSRIYKSVGKPRSKSQSRAGSRPKTRSSSPHQTFISGRVLVDSYLREISSKSKLSVSLDGMGICAFSYRKITFVIEVPIVANAGFMVYSSFDAKSVDWSMLSRKIDAWNQWLAGIKRGSRVAHVMAGNKTVFSLKGSEKDMVSCEVFQKTLEYFVEMSLKLHNFLHPGEAKSVSNVCLTTAPIPAS